MELKEEQLAKWKEENRKTILPSFLRLTITEKDLVTFKTIKLAVHTNMAACYLQKKQYSNTRDACRAVSRTTL